MEQKAAADAIYCYQENALTLTDWGKQDWGKYLGWGGEMWREGWRPTNIWTSTPIKAAPPPPQ